MVNQSSLSRRSLARANLFEWTDEPSSCSISAASRSSSFATLLFRSLLGKYSAWRRLQSCGVGGMGHRQRYLKPNGSSLLWTGCRRLGLTNRSINGSAVTLYCTLVYSAGLARLINNRRRPFKLTVKRVRRIRAFDPGQRRRPLERLFFFCGVRWRSHGTRQILGRAIQQGGENAGIERELARHRRLDEARSKYKQSAATYPNRLVMLCDRATVLARSDRNRPYSILRRAG